MVDRPVLLPRLGKKGRSLRSAQFSRFVVGYSCELSVVRERDCTDVREQALAPSVHLFEHHSAFVFAGIFSDARIRVDRRSNSRAFSRRRHVRICSANFAEASAGYPRRFSARRIWFHALYSQAFAGELRAETVAEFPKPKRCKRSCLLSAGFIRSTWLGSSI